MQCAIICTLNLNTITVNLLNSITWILLHPGLLTFSSLPQLKKWQLYNTV